ncbi:MAG TPA: ATP-binding protein [Gemmatimonadota bacterium]|nr:ATP-binding protein [Gemmatimonadota bacterium]
MDTHGFEKLGVFYLGRVRSGGDGPPGDGPDSDAPLLLYDSRDLTTHAVCVGMTGSGKTGLCIDLLEEAAIDGIPAIAIDPKGDLGNLLLTFPELRPEDFRPWIDEEEASRRGLDGDAYAAQVAAGWREGLAAWGQDGERIRRLREAVDFTIYTPGSTAGVPLSILRSLEAPPPAIREDAELVGDRIQTTVSSLLGLLGVDADPIRSREHVLVSTVLQTAWKEGQNLDLTGLIRAVQEPGIDRVGVMELESFFPGKERFELAMRLNNVLAAPSFAPWLEGEPLRVDRLLWTETGKPRVSVVSIAHLSDAERMFLVALLLNEVVGWVRTQPGTSSLRAIVYMDEIFGFFPPVANPPSKRPLLTLLKQARAHGLGIVLATQNPVDLDYKGLANAGTWFLGRLQTERDKARVLEGLEGLAERGLDRSRADGILSGLGKRMFLMHNVHEPEPVVFETRWAMSYLRGPLTRAEIQRLTGRERPAAAPAAEGAGPPETPGDAVAGEERVPPRARPILSPDIPQRFVPVRGPTEDLVYEPFALGVAAIRFEQTKAAVREERRVVTAAPLSRDSGAIDWGRGRSLDIGSEDLESRPLEGAGFVDPPGGVGDRRSIARWTKSFSDWVYRSQELIVLKSPTLEEYSGPGEGEREFRIRLQQVARERRDAAADTLRARYEKRIASAERRLSTASAAVEREAGQARHEKLQTTISLGATVLGSLFGGKIGRSTIGRATTAARGVGRSMRQAEDVARAREKAAAVREEVAALEAELQGELDELEQKLDPLAEELERVVVRPRRKDVTVELVALGWLPFRSDKAAGATPAW